MKQIKDFGYKFTRLTSFRNGAMTAAMSPMLSAQAVAEQLEENLIGIIRIDFKEDGHYSESILQVNEGTSQRWELTGFDHLIICFWDWFVFFMDMGDRANLIATCFDRNEVDIKAKDLSMFVKAPSDEQLIKMMNDAFNEVQKVKYEYYDNMKKLRYEEHDMQH